MTVEDGEGEGKSNGEVIGVDPLAKFSSAPDIQVKPFVERYIREVPCNDIGRPVELINEVGYPEGLALDYLPCGCFRYDRWSPEADWAYHSMRTQGCSLDSVVYGPPPKRRRISPDLCAATSFAGSMAHLPGSWPTPDGWASRALQDDTDRPPYRVVRWDEMPRYFTWKVRRLWFWPEGYTAGFIRNAQTILDQPGSRLTHRPSGRERPPEGE